MAKTNYNVTKLLSLGLVFHVVFIYSVFDCYFTSPVVHGMKSFNVGRAEAKRLMLIVGDGLRADLLFEKNGFPKFPDAPEVVAPYLRSIIQERGAYGVSHTRVPTESRPGHVAIIGGMYEDVSAVTKGWKTNPVDFDSVFNQSSHTFSFGSPDILPMFTRGAIPGRVREWSYHEDDEDFTKDATALDVWVLEQFKTLLYNATQDPLLDAQLRGDKVIFFLHLLGLDTTGHSYRPHSLEYMHNIQVVDGIIEQVEQLMKDFYRDEETSYVFTADHGMSVIGNHGDGHPDNTRTPLVTWGKGVRGPLPDSSPSSHDEYSQSWELSHLLRRDVEQADIAPLMASLVGIDWPVNSVGVLPDIDPTKPGFLAPEDGEQMLARAASVNAKMILESYRVQHENKRARKFFYKPFAPLDNFDSLVRAAEEFIIASDWNTARLKAYSLVRTGLEGLHYLQTYERTLIRSMVTAAYTGWAAYASLFVFRPLDMPGVRQSFMAVITIHLLSLSFFSAFCAMFVIEQAPWTYHLYIAFPCYFWDQFLAQASLPLLDIVRDKKHGIRPIQVALKVGMVLGTLLCMVFGYLHRSMWSLGFVVIGSIWPLFAWPKDVRQQLGMKVPLWTASCFTTAIFPLLEVNKTESLINIMCGGISMLIIGVVFVYEIARQSGGKLQKPLAVLFAVQAIFVVSMMLITRVSLLNLQAKNGLPPVSQALGWVVLVASSGTTFLSHVKHAFVSSKFLMYLMGLTPLFVILSISDETLFFVSYSVTLLLWIEVETAIARNTRSLKTISNLDTYQFKADDLRIVLFFLFFVQTAFFGTGNVASMASFYLSPVYRLIPVFNPFFMAVLLICKIVAPYVMLSIATAAVTHALMLPPFSLFLVALTITDGMTLIFFFNVTDTGSWLEIGQTISFFCISSLLLLWSGGICAAGEYLMADVLSRPKIHVS